MVDIQFDNVELDRNTEIILHASTQKQAQAVRQSYKIINDSINLFIQQYQIAYQKINEFQNQLKIIIRKWHEAKRQLQKNQGQNYKQSTDYIEYINKRREFMQQNFNDDIKKVTLNIYLLAFKIQEYLNAALGQTVVTAYIFEGEGGNPQVLLSNSMQDFLSVEVSSSGNLILRYREDQANLQNHIDKLQDMVSVSKENTNYQKLISAYNKAHVRYKKYPLKKKHGSYVLWLYPKAGQKWNGAYISSFGSVNEAYAYFLFHLEDFTPGNIPEEDMELFMNYLLINVTNESGLLSGDIDSNNMEIAVKSADASVLGIKQIYNLALRLKNQKIDNFQNIVSFLTKEKEKNKAKAKPINNSLKQVLQNIADKYLPEAVNNLTK